MGLTKDLICKNYKQGEKLDVEDLNTVTVLIDRSETILTEVGMNYWRESLVGPPHKHEQKEQIFFITAGSGEVLVSEEKFLVKTNDIIFIPVNSVHQTITASSSPLEYILFNAFKNANKEGHKSFADHIDRVKKTRKEQADTQKAVIENYGDVQISVSKGRYIDTITDFKVDNPRKPYRWNLLSEEDTFRSSAELIYIPGKIKYEINLPSKSENTFFVMSGKGVISENNSRTSFDANDIIFLHQNLSCEIESKQEPIKLLCLSTHLI